MTVAALVCAALATWASSGALTVLPFQAGAPRSGLLPSLLWLAGAITVALVFARTMAPQLGRRVRILFLSMLLFLPWLPTRVPPAFLIWAGPLGLWVLALLAAATCASTIAKRAPPRLQAIAADARRAPWLAGTIAAMLYGAGAWSIAPRLPAGDEPHYLVITQSLLRDHDLKVENNYLHGDYREFIAGDLKPHYLRRGQDGEIYSIHAPGLPALVAPVFGLFGYPGVLMFLSLVSAAATSLTWTAVWRVTRNAGASWFGWAVVALSAPFFFHAFTMYPDGPGGALLMVTVLALTEEEELSAARLVACGGTLAVLPWLHTRFAILALMAGAALALRLMAAERRVRRLSALLALPVASALAWFAFFYLVYGTPDPAAPYNGNTQTSMANLARGIPGLLFDQQFGLLPNAPAYLAAALGFVPLVRRRPRLASELMAVAAPYAVAVAAYEMWWGGFSAPARFLTPLLLPLAIPAGAWFAGARSAVARMLGIAAVFVSILITLTLATVERGTLLFNARDGASRLLLWISPLVDVTTGLPSLFQSAPLTAVAHALVWLVAIAMVTATSGFLVRRNVTPPTIIIVSGLVGAAMAMLALSLVWRSHGVTPMTPATASAALRRHFVPDGGQLGVGYSPFRILTASDVALASTREQWSAARSRNGPLVTLVYPLAATYELAATITRPGGGRVAVILDRQFGAAWTFSLPDVPGEWRQTFTLPTPVPALLIDADSATRRTVEHVSLRAVRLLDGGGLSDRRPIHVVRYGPAVVLLLSGNVYFEPTGACDRRGQRGRIRHRAGSGGPIRLFVRNSPVDNRIVLESHGWRRELSLKPREEQLIDVPVDRQAPGALLRVSCASGARPSDVEGSDDRRLLGCWIETR